MKQANLVKKDITGKYCKMERQLFMIAILALSGSFGSMEVTAQSIVQINNSIRTLERDTDFRNLNINIRELANLRQSLGTAESSFSRSSCQRALNAGQRLSRDCQILARQILRERNKVSELEQRVQAGQAIARQREQLLARRNSAGVSNVVVNERPTNFLEQLFGSFGPNSQTIIEGGQLANFGTVRSVCVRKADGYYWPVSFSTVPEYLPNDAAICNAQCPGKEVDLYYYSNPGQDPKDMVNLEGQPYSALPNAFSYRTDYDLANSCTTRVETGNIELVEIAGISRAYLSAGETSLPLPLRDPRRVVKGITATALEFPLPRPRPDHETGSGLSPALSAELRVVELNGKMVRLVGPDTPYGRSEVTGS